MDSQLFPVTSISLGEVVEGTQREIYFPYKGIQKIVKMTSPCDCSIPEEQQEHSRIKVRYVAKKIPVHLKQANIKAQGIKKEILITFISQEVPHKEQTITLSFNATVISL